MTSIWTRGASFFLLFLLSACGPQFIAKKDAFPEMYRERPVSILVLPPVNMTTAADAKEYYMTTLVEPLSLAGYYVFPIEVTADILKAEGLPDTELLLNTPSRKFKEYFGADAVLYPKILKWDTAYYVIGGNVTVSVDCLLKSTATENTLWRYTGTMVLDTSGDSGNSGGGLAGLLVKALATAVKTASTDYIPVAQKANAITISTLPFGKYRPEYGTDKDMQIVLQKKEGQEAHP